MVDCIASHSAKPASQLAQANYEASSRGAEQAAVQRGGGLSYDPADKHHFSSRQAYGNRGLQMQHVTETAMYAHSKDPRHM